MFDLQVIKNQGMEIIIFIIKGVFYTSATIHGNKAN